MQIGCSVCSTPTQLGCAACGVVRYCSVRCQTSDYKEHSTICAFFGDAFSPQTLLAVLRTLTDEQILTRIPPADTYDDLDNDVKEKCEHYSFRSFWKQRVKAFNVWAYDRVRPSREKMFEFWWSLCRATEALIMSDEIPAGSYAVYAPPDPPMKVDFVSTLLERKNIRPKKTEYPARPMANVDFLSIDSHTEGNRTYWAASTHASFYSRAVAPDVVKRVDIYLKSALLLGFSPDAPSNMLRSLPGYYIAARFPILNLV